MAMFEPLPNQGRFARQPIRQAKRVRLPLSNQPLTRKNVVMRWRQVKMISPPAAIS